MSTEPPNRDRPQEPEPAVQPGPPRSPAGPQSPSGPQAPPAGGPPPQPQAGVTPAPPPATAGPQSSPQSGALPSSGYGGPIPPGGWQQPMAPSALPLNAALAGWGSRVGATLLDAVVLLVLALVLIAPGAVLTVVTDGGALGILLLVVGVLVFFVVCSSTRRYSCKGTASATVRHSASSGWEYESYGSTASPSDGEERFSVSLRSSSCCSEWWAASSCPYPRCSTGLAAVGRREPGAARHGREHACGPRLSDFSLAPRSDRYLHRPRRHLGGDDLVAPRADAHEGERYADVVAHELEVAPGVLRKVLE